MLFKSLTSNKKNVVFFWTIHIFRMVNTVELLLEDQKSKMIPLWKVYPPLRLMRSTNENCFSNRSSTVVLLRQLCTIIALHQLFETICNALEVRGKETKSIFPKVTSQATFLPLPSGLWALLEIHSSVSILMRSILWIVFVFLPTFQNNIQTCVLLDVFKFSNIYLNECKGQRKELYSKNTCFHNDKIQFENVLNKSWFVRLKLKCFP